MTNDCEQNLLKISDHIDTNAEIDATTQLHINNCATCKNFIQAWNPKSTLTKTAHAQIKSNHPSLADQIIKNLPSPQENNSKNRHFISLLATAAALVIGLFIWKYQQPTPTPTTPITLTEKTQTIQTTEVPPILKTINKETINTTITSLGQSSSELINTSSKSIHTLTSKIEYVSTNLSSFIVIPQIPDNLNTSIITPSNHA